MYEFLSGRPPFEAETDKKTYKLIRDVQVICPPHFSDLAVDLINKVREVVFHLSISSLFMTLQNVCLFWKFSSIPGLWCIVAKSHPKALNPHPPPYTHFYVLPCIAPPPHCFSSTASCSPVLLCIPSLFPGKEKILNYIEKKKSTHIIQRMKQVETSLIKLTQLLKWLRKRKDKPLIKQVQ